MVHTKTYILRSIFLFLQINLVPIYYGPPKQEVISTIYLSPKQLILMGKICSENYNGEVGVQRNREKHGEFQRYYRVELRWPKVYTTLPVTVPDGFYVTLTLTLLSTDVFPPTRRDFSLFLFRPSCLCPMGQICYLYFVQRKQPARHNLHGINCAG